MMITIAWIVQSRCKKGAPSCCLCTVNGHPLIASVIEAQAAAGVTEIAIVVGYLGGNAVSVHRAREWADGSVVVCMGDRR
ncbi:hypothetical protein ES707_04507 [subsurface metagenome]